LGPGTAPGEVAPRNQLDDPGYSLLLEGVDDSIAESLQQLDGDEADAPPGGDLRIDFSASDLEDFREMALEELADEVAMMLLDRGARLPGDLHSPDCG